MSKNQENHIFVSMFDNMCKLNNIEQLNGRFKRVRKELVDLSIKDLSIKDLSLHIYEILYDKKQNKIIIYGIFYNVQFRIEIENDYPFAPFLLFDITPEKEERQICSELLVSHLWSPVLTMSKIFTNFKDKCNDMNNFHFPDYIKCDTCRNAILQ